VAELIGRGPLKCGDLAALGVHARHHVLDGAVLAGRIERLEDHQHCVRVGRVQELLHRGKFLFELLEILFGQVLRTRFVLGVQPAALGHLRAPAFEVG